MKKLIAIICILIILCFAANISYACENQILMPDSIYEEICNEYTYWIITKEHSVVGLAKEKEEKIEFTMFSGNNMYVRGIFDDGIIRAKGTAEVICIDGKWYGLTAIKTNVVIYENYKALVESIVKTRIECEQVNNQAIIASTIWRKNNYAAHIFFMPNAGVIEVGYIEFVDQNLTAKLYAGYFYDQNELVLGFIASHGCVETTVEPSVEPKPECTPEPTKNNESTCVQIVTENKTTTTCTKKQTQSTNTVYNNTIINVGTFTNTVNTINNDSQSVVNFQSPFSSTIINPILKKTILNKNNCNK